MKTNADLDRVFVNRPTLIEDWTSVVKVNGNKARIEAPPMFDTFQVYVKQKASSLWLKLLLWLEAGGVGPTKILSVTAGNEACSLISHTCFSSCLGNIIPGRYHNEQL